MKNLKAAWEDTMVEMAAKHCREMMAEGMSRSEAASVATAYQQRVEGYLVGWLWGFLIGACIASIVIWVWRMFL